MIPASVTTALLGRPFVPATLLVTGGVILFLLACFAAIVGIEFLRQRSPSRFMGETGGFLLMALVLLPSIRYAGDGSFCTKNSKTVR